MKMERKTRSSITDQSLSRERHELVARRRNPHTWCVCSTRERVKTRPTAGTGDPILSKEACVRCEQREERRVSAKEWLWARTHVQGLSSVRVICIREAGSCPFSSPPVGRGSEERKFCAYVLCKGQRRISWGLQPRGERDAGGKLGVHACAAASEFVR